MGGRRLVRQDGRRDRPPFLLFLVGVVVAAVAVAVTASRERFAHARESRCGRVHSSSGVGSRFCGENDHDNDNDHDQSKGHRGRSSRFFPCPRTTPRAVR